MAIHQLGDGLGVVLIVRRALGVVGSTQFGKCLELVEHDILFGKFLVLFGSAQIGTGMEG